MKNEGISLLVHKVYIKIKKKYKVFLFINMIIVVTFLSGCWNYQDLEEQAIVAGAAIDKNIDGKGYIMTSEIIDMSISGAEVKMTSKLVEMEGYTIFDTIRNTIQISAKKLYWAHAQVIIISQDVAKEGITEIVDWLHRDAEFRISTILLISKEKTAKDLLIQESILTEIRSMEIPEMIESQKSLAKSPDGKAYVVKDELLSEGICAVLPTAEIRMNLDQRTLRLSGLAVIKGGKLIGFLEEEDTKYYLFIRDKIEGGLITQVKEKGKIEDVIALEIFKNKTQVKPSYEEGKLSIHIQTKTEVAVAEQGAIEAHSQQYNIHQTKNRAERTIESNIKSTIEKVQDDFGADIFGFGEIIKAEMPDVWKVVGDDWEKNFKNLDVSIDSEINIRNTGLLAKPTKIGD